MSTKSKSPLITIIIIAIIAFISAIIWKNTRVDNSEEIYIQPVSVQKPINKTKTNAPPVTITTQEIKPQSEESRQDAKVYSQKKMGWYTKYKSPEQIVDAVKILEKLGRHDEADELIQMLIERFPDYDM